MVPQRPLAASAKPYPALQAKAPGNGLPFTSNTVSNTYA
jgi:hypothetical protein